MTISLREKIKAYKKELTGDASSAFQAVLDEYKKDERKKMISLQKVFVTAKNAADKATRDQLLRETLEV